MYVNVRERSGMVRLPAFCLLALLFTASLAVTAHPGYFPDAVEAYDRGDYKTAYGIWKELADQGDAHAQNRLGTMYAEGKGVPQDFAEVLTWYRKAAEQGYAKAQYNLGVLYDNGRGVPQDYAEAVTWYRRAAGQEDPDAQSNLGVMYGQGQGVSQDLILAHMWFTLAVSRFPASEEKGREKALKNRDIVASRMTPAQISEAQRLAREWKPEKEVK
jgi:TPR repeat protein